MTAEKISADLQFLPASALPDFHPLISGAGAVMPGHAILLSGNGAVTAQELVIADTGTTNSPGSLKCANQIAHAMNDRVELYTGYTTITSANVDAVTGPATLTADAAIGATSVTVNAIPASWTASAPATFIAFSSIGFADFETRQITSISGNTITFSPGLTFAHPVNLRPKVYQASLKLNAAAPSGLCCGAQIQIGTGASSDPYETVVVLRMASTTQIRALFLQPHIANSTIAATSFHNSNGLTRLAIIGCAFSTPLTSGNHAGVRLDGATNDKVILVGNALAGSSLGTWNDLRVETSGKYYGSGNTGTGASDIYSAATSDNNPIIQRGMATLASGTVNVTLPVNFLNTSYQVIVVESSGSSSNAMRVTNKSVSGFTITSALGTDSSFVDWIAIGLPA